MPVIASARFVPAGSVRPVCHTPASGEPLCLLQQKSEIGPFLLLAAPGIVVGPLAQAASHDQIEVQAVQFPPRLQVGLHPAFLNIGICAQLLFPKRKHLLHQAAELFRTKLSLPICNLPPEGVIVALHVAHKFVHRLLQVLKVFFIDFQLFLRQFHMYSPFLS